MLAVWTVLVVTGIGAQVATGRYGLVDEWCKTCQTSTTRMPSSSPSNLQYANDYDRHRHGTVWRSFTWKTRASLR
ncbi:MAG: hypothetical protein ACLT98_08975 [Eggerthellaceae bacterium]